MDDIEPITCTPPPFGLDDKIFYVNDEDGNQIGEPYSYNDWMKMITDISGVNRDLMGPYNEKDL